MAIQTNYDSYIMNQEIVGMRKGGRRNESTILEYEDGTEWVLLNNPWQERFCGFLYLQNALKESKLDKVEPEENKMALNGKQIIYLSRYCGEKKPEFFYYLNEFHTLNEIGFTDTSGGANLREKDGKIYVFDTQKISFDKDVYEKIDSFVHLHDAIRSSLEERLKD